MSTKAEKGKAWDALRISPGTLTRMVAAGQAKIVGKDKFGRRLYVLKRPKADG